MGAFCTQTFILEHSEAYKQKIYMLTTYRDASIHNQNFFSILTASHHRKLQQEKHGHLPFIHQSVLSIIRAI
jgi:hypothetical protein